MKTFRLLLLLVLASGVYVSTADAQKRSTRRTTTAKKPTTRKVATPKPAVTSTMILAKTKVSNQLSNVRSFVDLLGPIALGIETADAEAKTKRVPKTALDANEANKQKVIAAIRNLRTGIVNLETEFRTKPDLKKYLVNIQGISDLAAQSEDSALAGQFVASKEPLRTVAQKLQDTMAVLP